VDRGISASQLLLVEYLMHERDTIDHSANADATR